MQAALAMALYQPLDVTNTLTFILPPPHPFNYGSWFKVPCSLLKAKSFTLNFEL